MLIFVLAQLLLSEKASQWIVTDVFILYNYNSLQKNNIHPD